MSNNNLQTLWNLKDQLYTILINKYDAYTRFTITEHPYHLTTCKFLLDIRDTKSVINSSITKNVFDLEGSIIIDQHSISIIGQGPDVEDALYNLAKKVSYTFNEWEINELVQEYYQSTDEYLFNIDRLSIYFK